MNSVKYGLSDSYQMALLEGLKVQASHPTMILAEEGPTKNKNYETYNRSERKQVFTSNSKFQIKRFR